MCSQCLHKQELCVNLSATMYIRPVCRSGPNTTCLDVVLSAQWLNSAQQLCCTRSNDNDGLLMLQTQEMNSKPKGGPPSPNPPPPSHLQKKGTQEVESTLSSGFLEWPASALIWCLFPICPYFPPIFSIFSTFLNPWG